MCRLYAMVKFHKEYEFLLWVDIMDDIQARTVIPTKQEDGYIQNADLISKEIQVQDHTYWRIEIGGLLKYTYHLTTKAKFTICVQFASKDNFITIPVLFDKNSEYHFGIIQCSPKLSKSLFTWRRRVRPERLQLHMAKDWCEVEFIQWRKVMLNY